MEVWYNDAVVGTIETAEEGAAVRFSVRCRPDCDARTLLRCYGVCPERDFLVGLLEPRGGVWTLTRRVSRETLRQAGCEPLPAEYYLAENGPRPKRCAPVTGDPLLDHALTDPAVTWEETAHGLRLRCPFDAARPFPLAFIATLCCAADGEAVLDWKEKAPVSE